MNNLEFLVKNYQTPPEAITLVENSRILLLAGISGAGKDTTKKHLLKNEEYRDIVSHTTRQPRENNGKIEHLHSVSSNGVRTADISIFDQNTNQWILKVKRDGITPQETTLFPESWSKSRIIVEVDIAYNNKIVTGRYWEGTTPSGIKVRGYLYPNTTVYPLP